MKTQGRKYGLLLIAPILMGQAASSTEVNYSDVAVIVNSASPVSESIADYYIAARSIPEGNVIRVTAPTAETISASEFADLRAQIEQYLNKHQMADAINYIVTTKGLPLRVDRGATGTSYSQSSSVESELTCILGTFAGQIGGGGGTLSPYFTRTEHFSRAQFGIYLVTRLDGYSLQDVMNLIDRSGPTVLRDTHAPYVLDQDPDWPASYKCLNTNIEKAGTLLSNKGCSVVMNIDSTYLTSEPNVAGYVSWGSNDHHADAYTQNAIPKNTWAPGAIAETYVSTSARSFDNPPTYGQSLIADLIHEGATGAKGYVYEPFLSAMADVSVLFGRYTSGYNLAESFYSASRYVSWMDVVIGDPKTSTFDLQGALPIQLLSFDAELSPDPSSVQLSWTTASETNNFGFMVQHRPFGCGEFADLSGSLQHGAGTTVSPRSYIWTDLKVEPGTHEYRLRQIDLDGSYHFSDFRSVTVAAGLTGVGDSFQPIAPGLDQNYPNPFNPTTNVTYRLAEAGRVSLVIYDALGREITTLVNGAQGPGRYTVSWNATGVAAGVYFCRLTAGSKVWVQRMISLK
jgi:uncharacterized protein (TIGR03790 family)